MNGLQMSSLSLHCPGCLCGCVVVVVLFGSCCCWCRCPCAVVAFAVVSVAFVSVVVGDIVIVVGVPDAVAITVESMNGFYDHQSADTVSHGLQSG